MDIAISIAVAICVVMLAASLFGFDDVIVKISENKLEAARENRRAAEARTEEARIKASDAYRNHP